MESDFKVVIGTLEAKQNLDNMITSAFSPSKHADGADNGEEEDDSDEDEDEVEMFRRREVKKMFDIVDKDGSKYIDKGEMRKLLKSIGREYTNEEINEGIHKIDVDGSGHIEFSEFYEWFKSIQNGSR